MSNANTVVILTALQLEYQAVRVHLSNLAEKVHPRGTIYECGQFAAVQGSWDVALVEIGMGNANAATETERAIDFFDPGLAFFVGVAGGIKDVTIGDVVAASKMYGYESGKAGKAFLPRPEVGNSAHALEQRARAEARRPDWLRRIQTSAPTTPRAFVGPIAAGEKVVAAENSAVYEFLRQQYSDALAVEMEGFGFMRAVLANHQVQAMVVRGVSDLIAGKNPADDHNWQPIAAAHAAAFTFQMLSQLQPAAAAATTPTTTVITPGSSGEPFSHDVLVHVSSLIQQYFNSAEIKDVCFRLGISYEDLEGQGPTAKSRELVTYLNRRLRLPELVTALRQLRPEAPWPVL